MSDQTESMLAKSFFETLVGWLTSLPTDIKVLIEMIGDDELDMKARTLAVGTLVYLIASIDLIPDTIPVLGLIDDVLILHIALAVILQIDAARAEHYRIKYPGTTGAIEEQVRLLTDTLGALYSWLTAFVRNLSQRRYKGLDTNQAAQSAETREQLFDDAMVFAAQVNVDEEMIRNKLIAAPPDPMC